MKCALHNLTEELDRLVAELNTEVNPSVRSKLLTEIGNKQLAIRTLQSKAYGQYSPPSWITAT